MTGKRKFEELLQKDLQVVSTLLQSEPRRVRKSFRAEIDFQNPFSPRTNRWCSEVFSGTNDSGTRPIEEIEYLDSDELRQVIDKFVDFYERLDTTDFVTRRPNYSYTELIFLALMRSPNFCLPIHEIYRYIGYRFSYFRKHTKDHWKNAVRHSLSKTRCFTKISAKKRGQRSMVLNRSCFLWTIVPRSLLNFAKGDYRSNVDGNTGTNTLKWAFHQVNAAKFWEKCADAVDKIIQQQMLELETASDSSTIFEQQICMIPETVESDDEEVALSSDYSLSAIFTSLFGDEQCNVSSTEPLPTSARRGIATDISTSDSDSDRIGLNSSNDSSGDASYELTSDDVYKQFVFYQNQHPSAYDDGYPMNTSSNNCLSFQDSCFGTHSTNPTAGLPPFAHQPAVETETVNTCSYFPWECSGWESVMNDSLIFDTRNEHINTSGLGESQCFNFSDTTVNIS